MVARFATISLTIVALSGCASFPSSRDDLCAPLLDFARSVGPEEGRSIAFHTSWGSSFRSDPEPAMFARRCVHGDHGPARAVCDYLFEHGAIEFAGRNAKRALSCLAPGTYFGSDINLIRGIFHIDFGTPSRGSHITVEFAEDEEIGGMLLRIVADGYQA